MDMKYSAMQNSFSGCEKPATTAKFEEYRLLILQNFSQGMGPPGLVNFVPAVAYHFCLKNLSEILN